MLLELTMHLLILVETSLDKWSRVTRSLLHYLKDYLVLKASAIGLRFQVASSNASQFLGLLGFINTCLDSEVGNKSGGDEVDALIGDYFSEYMVPC
jgi:hypothetical protein